MLVVQNPAEAPWKAAQTPSKVILREELHEKLVRAAQVRSVSTMLSVIPTIAVAFGAPLLLAQLGAPAVVTEIIFIPLLFGPPLIVCWILTERYCKPAASCPHCEGSLWACGSGNFKPRRMNVRYDAKACPHCGAPIV